MAEPTLEERAITYIETMRQHFTIYHNHKEQMAFVATTLYLTGVSILTLQKDTDWAKIFPYCITNALIIVLTIVAVAFVWWQLRKRVLANHLVSACDRLRRRWVENYPHTDSLPAACADYEGILMPAFLKQEIDRMSPMHLRSLPNVATIATMILWCIMLLARLYLLKYPSPHP